MYKIDVHGDLIMFCFRAMMNFFDTHIMGGGMCSFLLIPPFFCWILRTFLTVASYPADGTEDSPSRPLRFKMINEYGISDCLWCTIR